MNLTRDIRADKKTASGLIAIMTIMCIVISLLSLSSGFYIIFQNLFYIPIILSCLFYTRRGFLFSLILSFFYLGLLLGFAGFAEFEYGIARVVLFIAIAAITTILSERATEAKEKVSEKNEELKALNEKLKISRDRYHTLFESSGDLMFLHKVDENGMPGRFIEVNKSACEHLGYSREELLRMTVIDIAGEKGKNEAKEQIKILLNKGDHKFESTQLRKDGTEYPVEVNCHLIKTESHGDLALSVARDITERKNMEEALLQSEEKYRNLSDNAPVGIITCDRQGKITYVNDKVVSMLGSPSAEKTMEINLLDTPNIIKSGFSQILKDIIENGNRYPELEINYKSLWGKELYLRAHAIPLTEEGINVGAMLILDDITRRKETESLLERIQFAFDHSPDEIYFVNREGLIIYANVQACEKFGIEKSSDINKTIFDINPMFTPKMWDALWSKLMKEDYVRLESVHTDTKGFSYPVDIIKNLISFEGEDYSCTIARDITESKKSKEALKKSEGELRTLIQTIPDLIFLKDINGVYLACNKMFERFFGAKEIEITGKTDYDFLDKELADFFRKKDTEAVEKGSPSVNEEWITFADDGRRACLETIKTPVYDSDGILTGVLGIGRDITDRKNSEDAIKEINRKLNLLSSITRHDILNQITVASGYLEIIKMDGEIPKGTKTEEYIGKVSGAVDTIKRQISFTGYYKELGENLPQWFDLGDTIKSVAKTSSFEEIEIHDEIQGIGIFADPLFEKVIYNLIDNAVKHGETITKITFHSEIREKELVIFCEDDGVGISEDVKEKIFRREHYKNSGLGLFLSREILAITGLTIKETGTEGKGARFEIHVPEGMFRLKSEN